MKRAYISLGFIKRLGAQFTSAKIFKVLYCAYVRSILEYCSQVWNPRYKIYINRLETIQTKFMRFLQFKTKVYDPDYETRCRRHHILPLEERRRIADIVLYSKIAQSEVDSSYLLSLLCLRVPPRPIMRESRQSSRLGVPRGGTNYRRNAFFIRAASSFNALADFPELDIFNTSTKSIRRTLVSRWLNANI